MEPITRGNRTIRRTVVLTAAALALAANVAAADVRLPQLGEPADAALSPRDEARIGREVMRQASRSSDVDRDPQLAAYVDNLGQDLARHLPEQPVNGYTFFVIHQNRINAFATPGGYIAIYTGLIREASQESELAGVLAHEIAHVSQRHIARSIMAQQENAPATIAQILGGILLGTINPQAGQALVIGGLAGQAQQQIDYTRSNEEEADRIGIRILAEAGYDPGGMAGFFEVLRRQERGAIDAAPEYLRTHPLSGNRLAEAQSRAERLSRSEQRNDSLDFQLIHARARAIESDEPERLRQRLAATGPYPEIDREAGRQYGLALLEMETGQVGAARERIERLRGQHRDNLWLMLGAAQAERQQGDHKRAEELYRQALDLYPSAWPAALALGDMLRQNNEAERAAGFLARFLRSQERPPPRLWRELARARDAAGQDIATREALAQWYATSFRYSEAIEQLELGLELAEEDSNAEKRLRARLQEVRNAQQGRLVEDPFADGLKSGNGY